jgi:hypothetical protein
MSVVKFFVLTPSQATTALGLDDANASIDPRAIDGGSPGSGVNENDAASGVAVGANVSLSGNYVVPQRLSVDPDYQSFCPDLVQFLLALPICSLETDTIFAAPSDLIYVSDVTFSNKLAVRDCNTSAAGVATFDSWLGRSADYITVFLQFGSWASFDASVSTIIANYSGDTRPKIWTIGPTVTGTSLASAASGSGDSHFLAAAHAIVADAPASGFIFVRIGHEFNLAGGYPWEVINSNSWTNFVAAFRRVAGLFRSVSPRFRFIWNPNWITINGNGSGSGSDVTAAYPGDAYVDVIGADFYYNSSKDDTSSDVAFNYVRDLANSGLAWQVSFARAHGKALCVCEFGTNWDKPKWIDLVYSWVTSNGYAYAGYWDNSVLDFVGRLSDNSKPDCAVRFISDFKNGGPVPLFNDTFAFGNDNWSTSGASASFSVVSAVAQVTGVSNFADRSNRTWTGLTVGATYRVELDIDTNSLVGKINVIENGGSFSSLGFLNTTTTGLTRKTLTFTATRTSAVIQIIPFAGNAGQVVKFDNVQLFAA